MKRVIWNTHLLDDANDPAHVALRLHQDFKWHFIAGRKIDPGQSYEISGVAISAWIRDLAIGQRLAAEIGRAGDEGLIRS